MSILYKWPIWDSQKGERNNSHARVGDAWLSQCHWVIRWGVVQEPRAWTITLMFFFSLSWNTSRWGGKSRLCIFRFLLCMITNICVIDTTMGTEQDKVQSDARTCAHIVLLLPFDQKDRTIAQSECDEYSWVEIISMVGLNLQLQGKVHHPNPSCLLHLILTCLAQHTIPKNKKKVAATGLPNFYWVQKKNMYTDC